VIWMRQRVVLVVKHQVILAFDVRVLNL